MLVVIAGWLRSLPVVGVVAVLLTLPAAATAQTRTCEGIGSGQLAGASSTCKSSAAPPRWRACGSIAFAPNTEWGVSGIRARRATCPTARRVARAAKPTSVVDGPFTYRAHRFTCRGRARDEGLPTVKWSCTRKGGARVEFVMS